MESRPDLSISIVVHNSARDLNECLIALGLFLAGAHAELIVVDNASPDDSAAIVRTLFPSARIIALTENRGFAAGCNLAWRSAHGRYWLLLNPDVILPADGAATLIAWMDRHADVGVASAEIVDANGTLQTAARRFPSIFFSLLQLSRLHHVLMRTRHGKRIYGTLADDADRLDADWVPGAVMIARRAAVEEVGLSESFFMYGEDIEWCWRLRRAEWRVGVCRSVRAQHRESSSALRTWGRAGTDERVVKGIHAATAAMRGPRYARWLALIELVARCIEAIHPLRSADHRKRSRAAVTTLAQILRGRSRIIAAPHS